MKLLNHVRLFETPWTVAHQAAHPWNCPGKSTGVGCHFLLQRIFPTQGLNSYLCHSLHWQVRSWPLAPPGKPFYTTVVLWLSCNWLFATPWTAACQASLSIIFSQSLFKLKSIESVMSSNHLILCHPILLPSVFPASGSFPINQLFTSSGQSIGASTSDLPVNI